MDKDQIILLEDRGLILITGEDSRHSQRKIYSFTERGLSLLPILVEMAHWTMSQPDIRSQNVDFLSKLSNGPSQPMNTFLEKLRKSQLSADVN